MKYSVLSIPGLPSSFAGLDSRFYHDPYPFMDVIRDLYGEERSFEAFLWPGGDLPLPTSRIMQKIPVFHGFAVYAHYVHGEAYRKQVLRVARSYVRNLLKESDVLFVISHSHGNKVFMDAMKGLKVPEEKKIVWLAQAPAFKNVIYGLASPKVKGGQLQSVIERCEAAAFFRVKTDILSGNPGCPPDLYFTYKPSWKEWIFMAHATVRERKDILRDLKKVLKKSL